MEHSRFLARIRDRRASISVQTFVVGVGVLAGAACSEAGCGKCGTDADVGVPVCTACRRTAELPTLPYTAEQVIARSTGEWRGTYPAESGIPAFDFTLALEPSPAMPPYGFETYALSEPCILDDAACAKTAVPVIVSATGFVGDLPPDGVVDVFAARLGAIERQWVSDGAPPAGRTIAHSIEALGDVPVLTLGAGASAAAPNWSEMHLAFDADGALWMRLSHAWDDAQPPVFYRYARFAP